VADYAGDDLESVSYDLSEVVGGRVGVTYSRKSNFRDAENDRHEAGDDRHGKELSSKRAIDDLKIGRYDMIGSNQGL
jgi:hypothetical protein